MKYWKLGVLAVLAICLVGGFWGYQHWRARAPQDKVGDLVQTFTNEGEVRFMVLGDSGSGEPEQMAVAEAMERRCETAQFMGIILLGDNFYMHGVDSVTDPQWEEKIWTPYSKPCLSRLPIFPVLGNHDYYGNPGAQIKYSEVNSRWFMPHRFYEVNFGELLKIVAIDTNVLDKCWNSDICALDFLQNSLRDSKSRWVFVTGHHPVTSASVRSNTYSDSFQGAILKNIMCERVDAYMSGHAHHLEHRRLPSCRTDFFTSGGGGASLYGIREGQNESLFVKSLNGFLDMQVSQNKLTFQFVDKDGQVLYENTKEKPL